MQSKCGAYVRTHASARVRHEPFPVLVPSPALSSELSGLAESSALGSVVLYLGSDGGRRNLLHLLREWNRRTCPRTALVSCVLECSGRGASVVAEPRTVVHKVFFSCGRQKIDDTTNDDDDDDDDDNNNDDDVNYGEDCDDGSESNHDDDDDDNDDGDDDDGGKQILYVYQTDYNNT